MQRGKKRGYRAAIVVLGLLLLAFLSGPAGAAIVTVDENGNGFFGNQPLQWAMQPDPGPGGLQSVLTYFLPFTGVQGDMQLMEGAGGTVYDIVRFNGNGTLCFYSDNVGGSDALADTSSPPGSLYAARGLITELGSETFNFATYSPFQGDPGYDPSVTSYKFISDGTAVVPLPPSVLLMGAGLLGLASWRKLRRG